MTRHVTYNKFLGSVLFVTNTVRGLRGDQGVVARLWDWLMTHLLQLIQFRLYGN